ncbi:hypothetical protein Pta02_12090 [Planobispora takensis]|uniref:Nuclear transport factor 2 family protein n=1 Tax=Planobispora takensis TaxID=1367882 RepID=A0A8J3WRI0_9ACTN|nr:hypothetical protein Pta02_12090 [Planobispora takensis]
MRRRCALSGPLATWIATLGTLAACTSATGGTGATSKSADLPVTTPVDPQASVKQAVLTAYRGMWQEFVSAARTADWKASELGEYATGDALVVLRHGLWLAHEKEQIVKGEPILRPEVTSLTPATKPTKAQVTDCVDDTGFLVHTRSGKRADGGAATGRHRTTADLALRKGSWYVTTFVLREAGTC